jgi:hypothetical protein
MHLIGITMGFGSIAVGLATAFAALFKSDIEGGACIFAGAVGLGMALIAWAMI